MEMADNQTFQMNGCNAMMTAMENHERSMRRGLERIFPESARGDSFNRPGLRRVGACTTAGASRA